MLELTIHEQGEGPALVMLHGWAMSSAAWGDFSSHLARSYRLICIDLPGHGDSAYEDHWSLDDILQAMARQLPSSCYLLGWSLGGMISLAYADQYPNRVKKLVMLASSAKFTQSDNWPCGQIPDVLLAFKAGLKENPEATIKHFLRLQTKGLVSPKKVNVQLKHSLRKTTVKGLESGLNILQQLDLRPALSRLTTPLLMVLGQRDQLIPVDVLKFSRLEKPDIDGCVIEQATHVPFLSHVTELNQRLQSFFSEQELIE